jgi:hypothetical protein
MHQKFDPTIIDKRQAIASACQSGRVFSSSMGMNWVGLSAMNISACEGENGSAYSKLTGAFKSRATATARRGFGLQEQYKIFNLCASINAAGNQTSDKFPSKQKGPIAGALVSAIKSLPRWSSPRRRGSSSIHELEVKKLSPACAGVTVVEIELTQTSASACLPCRAWPFRPRG